LVSLSWCSDLHTKEIADVEINTVSSVSIHHLRGMRSTPALEATAASGRRPLAAPSSLRSAAAAQRNRWAADSSSAT